MTMTRKEMNNLPTKEHSVTSAKLSIQVISESQSEWRTVLETDSLTYQTLLGFVVKEWSHMFVRAVDLSNGAVWDFVEPTTTL